MSLRSTTIGMFPIRPRANRSATFTAPRVSSIPPRLTGASNGEAGPGKRPMHTIIPGMLARGGRIVAPFGVMGGAYQANGHARFVSNLEDFGMGLQEALDAPRSFPWEGELRVERGYPESVHAALAEKGHNVVVPDTPIGGAQAIRIDHETGVLEGASDPRKDGCAIGY